MCPLASTGARFGPPGNAYVTCAGFLTSRHITPLPHSFSLSFLLSPSLSLSPSPSLSLPLSLSPDSLGDLKALPEPAGSPPCALNGLEEYFCAPAPEPVPKHEVGLAPGSGVRGTDALWPQPHIISGGGGGGGGVCGAGEGEGEGEEGGAGRRKRNRACCDVAWGDGDGDGDGEGDGDGDGLGPDFDFQDVLEYCN